MCGICFGVWSFVFAMVLERDANRLKRDAEEEKIKKLRRA
jgi:hypothetical protein